MSAIKQTRCLRHLLAGALGCLLAGHDLWAADASAFFESRIRPVLVESCFPCHSASSGKSKGGLLLDSREAILKGGESGTSLVPGDPEVSRLIQAVRYQNKDLQMPPDAALPPEKVADLAQWIKDGAVYPSKASLANTGPADISTHWAYQPVKSPALPKIKNKNWPRQPLDNFVLAEMELRKLSPGNPADKRTLIRRATFDLTGLPPAPAEVDAFLADNSSNAFEKMVDRLLASKQFGVRWGRHWLDVARYADSSGFEINAPFPNAWRYRDYVVDAINQDMPFDQFIREQLAGDLLPASDIQDQKRKWVATGFLVVGPKPLAEPDREKALHDVADEQIDATCKAFLGLTVSCARCHDHKFDPIPARDYYAMAGIFLSTATLRENSGANPFQQGAVPWSERPLGTAEENAAFNKHNADLQKAQQNLDNLRKMLQDLPGGINSKELDGVVVDNVDAAIMGDWKLSNYATNFVDKNYLQDGNLGKGSKTAVFRPNLTAAGAYEVRFAYTPRENRATNVQVRITGSKGTKTILVNERLEPQYDKAFVYLGIFDFDAGTNGTVTISNEGTKGFVVADAVQFIPLQGSGEMAMSMADGGKKKRTEDVPSTRDQMELQDKIADLRNSTPPPPPAAMAAVDGAIRQARLLIRGDVQKPAGEVPRGFITVADKRKSRSLIKPEVSGRLELADWIASAENPLTSRVIVNRVWQHLLGRGIVPTPDNFGVSGDKPSHPELLDHLAAEFVRQGWSMKILVRTIVLSSTYQLSSKADAATQQRDPDNRWLSHASIHRVEAEVLRDSLLAVSGRLDSTLGGPSLQSNLPPSMVNGNIAETAFSQPRRSLYLPQIRNDLPDMYQSFDVPDSSSPNGLRYVTSSPNQALFLLNSKFVMNEAAEWSTRLQKNTDESAAIKLAYEEAFSRPPERSELAAAREFLSDFTSNLASGDTAEKRLQAWKAFSHALMASAEFRFIH